MATNNKIIAKLLEKLSPLYERLKRHPKKVLRVFVLVLLIALVFNLLQYRYFPNGGDGESRDLSKPGVLGYPSNPIGNQAKLRFKRDRIRPELRETIRSLQSYLDKSKIEELTASDSLEMNRLYNQYKTLMHAYESDSL